MSATRDEVLRAMAEAVDSGVQQALRDYGISDEVIGADVERFAASLTTASYALAAAEQAGWVLRPVEPTEEMIEDMAIKLYEERARNLGLPMAKWENAPEMVRSLERRDAATAYRLVLAAAPKVGE